jgi:hypothetical protein
MTTRYYTADRPDGTPWAVWRKGPDGTAVYDPATRTWVPAGWPVKHLHGSSLNFSDLNPDDLDATVAAMTTGPINTRQDG